MKKLIPLILSAILIFSVIPSMDVEAASIKEQAGKAYADIIQNYLTVAELKKSGKEFSDYDEFNVNPEIRYKISDGNVIYNITDYNKDGTPELFISAGSSGDDYYSIYDVYTFYKGKAVRLMEDIGYRAGTCILCKNGIIKDFWSGDAFNSGVKFHKLKRNKNKLSTVIELEYDSFSSSKPTTYTKKVNGKKTKISYKKYQKLYSKYNKPIEVTFYVADSKAIKNVRNGLFTYQNQKKWKATTNCVID